MMGSFCHYVGSRGSSDSKHLISEIGTDSAAGQGRLEVPHDFVKISIRDAHILVDLFHVLV